MDEMPDPQSNETEASALKIFLPVLWSLLIFSVLLILWQLFLRSVNGGNVIDFKPVACVALICGLFPWGVLSAYLVAIRRHQWLLLRRAFLCNATAWIVAFIVFAFSIASTANKEDTGFRALMPVVGIVVSLALFGLLQFAGWLPGIPRGQRSRALKLLLVFPTLLALTVWYVGLSFDRYLNAAFTLGISTLILVGAPLLLAAILTACMLAHYLRIGLEEQHPAGVGQILDQLGVMEDTNDDPRT
jgi:hypothetical protein